MKDTPVGLQRRGFRPKATPRQPRTPQAITSMGRTLRRSEGAQARHVQASQRGRRRTHQHLEHPTATSLLSLARISKSFVVNHVINTPVDDNHVNITSSMKRATRLSPETQVTLGGYYGGHSPPKNGPIFSQKRKNPCTLNMFLLRPRAKFEQGAGSLAERTRKSEIAYASVRIRPFSLASDPAGRSRKSNSPN
jgi:hypothetical protein